MDKDKIRELEHQLGHKFKDRKLLYRALTHPTFSKEEKEKPVGARECPHQEIYATLGDAILRAVFVLLLMDEGLNTKGEITIAKAKLEKNLKLAEVGKRLHILENNLIQHNMGKGDELKKGRKKLRSDTVEAIIGAIFIDTNRSFTRTKNCISKIFKAELNE